MAPRVVIFDLGKVLVDFDYTRASSRIAARGNVSREAVRKFIDHSPLLVRYESGQMTTAQFFGEVAAATGFGGTAEEFAEFFADIFIPIPEMVELHAAVRRKGIPTFILSNTNELATGHIRRSFPFFSDFDGYVLSYQVGAIKPAEKIYRAAEEMAGKSGAELLFIDDLPANIAAAAARGWQVILQESPEKTRAQIAKLGLLQPAPSSGAV
jgi:HAD superfamily hydrolase (TIGR01509 family)